MSSIKRENFEFLRKACTDHGIEVKPKTVFMTDDEEYLIVYERAVIKTREEKMWWITATEFVKAYFDKDVEEKKIAIYGELLAHMTRDYLSPNEVASIRHSLECSKSKKQMCEKFLCNALKSLVEEGTVHGM